jgi:hypothetical protein
LAPGYDLPGRVAAGLDNQGKINMINIIYLIFAACLVSPDAVLNSVEGYSVEGEVYLMSVDLPAKIRRSF